MLSNHCETRFAQPSIREPCPKNLEELVKQITPPEGIRRKNIEGTELLDCDGPEIELSEQKEEQRTIIDEKDPDDDIEFITAQETTEKVSDIFVLLFLVSRLFWVRCPKIMALTFGYLSSS